MKTKSTELGNIPPEHKEVSPWFTTCRITWVSVLVRLVLVFRLLPPDLAAWIQSVGLASTLASPVYTLDHVREATAIRRLMAPHRFADAYQGHQIHLPPLVLACLQPFVVSIPTDYWQHAVLGVVLLVVDFLIAKLLEELGRALLQRAKDDCLEEESLQRVMPQVIQPKLSHIFPLWANTSSASDDASNAENEPLLRMQELPFLVAQLYFSSPITALSSGAFDCFQSIRTLLILISIVQTCRPSGSIVVAALSLAAATYFEIHSLVFLVPSAIFLYERMGQGAVITFVICFGIFTDSLHGLSLLLVGPAEYGSILLTTHGHVFQLAGVTPSLSVLWYFAMELFERFIGYFTILLGGLPYLLVAPTTIRLYRYPIELTAIFWLIWTVCRPIGTLYDLNFGLCLLFLAPRSLARMGKLRFLVSMCAIPVPVLLYLVMHWLWLETGTGEANFLFFQCLAYNTFCANVLVEFCASTVRRDKALRLTKKRESESPPVGPDVTSSDEQ